MVDRCATTAKKKIWRLGACSAPRDREIDMFVLLKDRIDVFSYDEAGARLLLATREEGSSPASWIC